mmetsp:Transcript_991/g.2035  ORF Transcript_991/g.2035 Transcript_991/m.2035 type:complete len:446 (-) Transcript_991:345-1682(-)|eukprot:CAMPEP_0197650844 /NCGR_PEP_ID=MMETSP1338-20131121/31187_1 /TAXON_ID=43686 ORGANISM="Pelagodinium beii, Strain RCC1491" /NCGR_SAMPLE_ID=MMETSP1338 /ASSEMBLY_ACC=CAM_ASM_000754 /LENGTH=445 /DNA_ID=CAMNT_0043225331 /DNA_START=61 /DNA_END=1398 /DNA_ORIENTATION=-
MQASQIPVKAAPAAQDAASSDKIVVAAKPRIDCIDGCRFALVLPIIIGHFIKFGTSNPALLKLLTQENVLVGGFFSISGYVTAYVSTNIGERSYSVKKLANPELFFWQKVMSYYPLHFVVSTAFAPMFILIDRWVKNSWSTTALHGFLNYSLLQAWFPSKAEIWNPPTWFLSALTFANLVTPTCVLPQISELSKNGLQKLKTGMYSISLLQKFSYSQAWKFYCRGGYRERPANPYLWNVTRFHPFANLLEIVDGMAAARMVMLDTGRDKERAAGRNPLWLFLASYATLALRITKFNFNDAMIRSLLFMPLYTKFLMTIHRDCTSENPKLITRFFGSRIMTWLGSLAFPMFLLHGPIGQLFYKKSVATRLWGKVMPKPFFPIYLFIVMMASHIMNEHFVKNKSVQQLSARVSSMLAERVKGMLRDEPSKRTRSLQSLCLNDILKGA